MANGSQYLNRLLQLALRQIGPAHREQAGPSWAYVDPVRWTGSLTSAFPRSSKRAGFNDNIVPSNAELDGCPLGLSCAKQGARSLRQTVSAKAL